jgi:hypothetical protein
VLKRVVTCCSVVLVLGCASNPPTVYMPSAGEEVVPFFANGQPIAAVDSDEAFLLMAVEPARVGSMECARVWLLYQNKTDEPYLLEPMKFATLIVNSEPVRAPQTPTSLLERVSNDQAVSMIVSAIGGSLEAAAAAPKDRNRVLDRTEDALTDAQVWYAIYKSSLNQGILRRNTVFPQQSVNGYIYFALDDPADTAPTWGNTGKKRRKPAETQYRVACSLPAGSKEIAFLPIEGE